MNSLLRPYSGRLIFDHFPKTAGQAVSTWLTDSLGSGSVRANLDSSHQELVGRTGHHPIICAHAHFAAGEGLDPRIQYATMLREPIDRSISWLFFVTRNHEREQLPGLYEEVETFLASDGEAVGPRLAPAITNPMVNHYARILGNVEAGDDALVETAYRAIQGYDLVGIYERLGEFTAGLGELVGIPAPGTLQPINVTVARPACDAISLKLRDKLLSLTELDRRLYDRVAVLVGERLTARRPKPPKVSKWARYDKPAPTAWTTPLLTLHHARPLHEEPICAGSVLRFELDFELHEPVKLLQTGFHIFDDRKRWAFGVNNVLLDQPFADLAPGRYRLVYFVTTELVAGDYTIGFAFADVGGTTERPLYWHDEQLNFTIRRPGNSIGVGSANCAARMMIEPVKIWSIGNREKENVTTNQPLAA